jgi:hypothetical protein
MENRANSARALLSKGASNPAGASDEKMVSLNPPTIQGEGANDSKDEPGEGSSASSSGADSKPVNKRAAIKVEEINSLQNQVSIMGQAVAFNAKESAEDGEADDASGEIMGFPKDCGPRKGVRILSYKRAMHVRAMNHPHLSFERHGKHLKW